VQCVLDPLTFNRHDPDLPKGLKDKQPRISRIQNNICRCGHLVMLDGLIREISEICGVFLLVNVKICWTHYTRTFESLSLGVMRTEEYLKIPID
jgi:hypothetical protein